MPVHGTSPSSLGWGSRGRRHHSSWEAVITPWGPVGGCGLATALQKSARPQGRGLEPRGVWQVKGREHALERPAPQEEGRTPARGSVKTPDAVPATSPAGLPWGLTKGCSRSLNKEAIF